MRRIYILVVVLVVGMIGMTYLYFSNLNTETTANDLSLNAVASNSSIIFSFENDKGFYEILNGQDLIQQVIGENNSKLFRSIKKNLVDDNSLNQLINGQKIYIGVTSQQNNEIDFLISTQSKDNLALLINNIKINKTKLKNIENGYQFNFADSSTCFLAIKNKLILISNSLNQIENSINDTKEDQFSNFIKTNSRFNKNTLANLYIDFNKIPTLLKGVLNSNLTGELEVFNKQNTYAALSYNFSAERLLFNGTTVINNPNSFYQLFTNVAEQKITITSILPDKTANYTTYAISDYSSFHKDFSKLMEHRKEDQVIKNALQKIFETYRIDLAHQFPSNFKDQFITFQLNTGEKFGAVALKNGDKVNQLLLDISSEYAPEIRVFKEAKVPYAFFGDPFKKFEKPFYTVINGYLVMANNASSIQSFLNSYSNDKLLINTEDYQNFSNQLSTSSTITYYINQKNSIEIFGKNLKKPYYKKAISKSEIGGFSSFSYQLSADKGKFLSNVLFYKTTARSIQPDSTMIVN
jgi:hypothetical protein